MRITSCLASKGSFASLRKLRGAIDKQYRLGLSIARLFLSLPAILSARGCSEIRTVSQQLHNNPHLWRDIVSGRRSSGLRAQSTQNAARSSVNYQKRSP